MPDITLVNPPIADQFYNSIFENASSEVRTSFLALQDEKNIKRIVQGILQKRLSTTTPPIAAEIAILLHLIRNFPDPEARLMVLEASRKLRKKMFGNKVATMVPIEMSSFCASNCKFCGWRKDNSEMIRLRLSKDALVKEAKLLAELGFTHFELAAADDLGLIRSELPEVVASVKRTLLDINRDARLSICLTPLPESYYRRLTECGLDCILTWQETYDRDTYYTHITSGPKAKGLREDLSIDPKGDGYLSRIKSQENAVHSGLQVGVGVMLGLSTHLEADILSVIIHGNELISHYRDLIEPLIIGLPIWNPITTSETDNLCKYPSIHLESEDLELVSAIYLLSFPNYHSWVFPNCRIPKVAQLRNILTAGCFTSTMVLLGPGGYLAKMTDSNLDSNYTRVFNLQSSIHKEAILQGEQFTHAFDSHENFLSMFREAQLDVVSDAQFLLHQKG